MTAQDTFDSVPRMLLAIARRGCQRAFVATAAIGFTLAFFLVLPVIQAINRPAERDTSLRSMDTASLPPPPPPMDEPDDDEEQEEEPPELEEESPKLDLAALELALNPGMGDGWMSGSFGLSLDGLTAGKQDMDTLLSDTDLDQKPRPIYQPAPRENAQTRKKGAAKVQVIFVVNEQGRVEHPRIQVCPDPVFERPTLAAVKQWRFEPGQRNGEPVAFRTRVRVMFGDRDR